LVNVVRFHGQQYQIYRELIEQFTEISVAHLTPEIQLSLIKRHAEKFNEEIGDPFWGFYWPGGQGLARYARYRKAISSSVF